MAAGISNSIFPAVVGASLFLKAEPTLEKYSLSLALIMAATLLSKLALEGGHSWPHLHTWGGARALGDSLLLHDPNRLSGLAVVHVMTSSTSLHWHWLQQGFFRAFNVAASMWKFYFNLQACENYYFNLQA